MIAEKLKNGGGYQYIGRAEMARRASQKFARWPEVFGQLCDGTMALIVEGEGRFLVDGVATLREQERGSVDLGDQIVAIMEDRRRGGENFAGSSAQQPLATTPVRQDAESGDLGDRIVRLMEQSRARRPRASKEISK